MKIVKFKNEKFGVRRGFWLMGYQYLDKDGVWWSISRFVVKYCQFDTLEQAQGLLGFGDKGEPI